MKLYVYRYMPIVLLYFFFNSAGLPLGLTYCAMLSPMFWLWLYRKGQRWVTLKFAVCLLPFAIVHAMDGVDSSLYYLRSALLFWTAYVTVFAFCVALLEYKRPGRLFDVLIAINSVAALVALAVYFTPYREVLWSVDAIALATRGAVIYRLKWLVTEPSLYAGLMLPLILFATLRMLHRPSVRSSLYLGLIAVPFLLSQSFGGLSMYAAGVGTGILATYRRALLRPRTLAATVAIAVVVAGLAYVPSPISTRISQVTSGNDSSVDSRTVSAFIVAQIVVSHKNPWWGVGLGQAKLVDLPTVGLAFRRAVIPNAIADLYAEMGVIGVLLKIGAEVWLFFATKTYRNSFRIAMFVIAFILQLTGGYIEDVQEYLTWCFAFCPFFPQFDLDSRIVKRNA